MVSGCDKWWVGGGVGVEGPEKKQKINIFLKQKITYIYILMNL